MPQIRVRFFAAAREAFGTRECSTAATTLGDLVTALNEGAGTEASTVLGRSSFLVNAIATTDRDVTLNEGDTVDVLPPFAGG
ncbi:MoaD/ThiS family protein [Brevibacterium marinum]|uniref:Molybdopterin converting factor small subunit n=1 Tax=Brevibacterium marinum TaxID=418643 RepID=A0A846RT97_9MICO|nr:molybdopterin converting factor small subunit [Brevibacterium marinum]